MSIARSSEFMVASLEHVGRKREGFSFVRLQVNPERERWLIVTNIPARDKDGPANVIMLYDGGKITLGVGSLDRGVHSIGKTPYMTRKAVKLLEDRLTHPVRRTETLEYYKPKKASSPNTP